MRFGLKSLFVFGNYSVFCYTYDELSQFWRNLLTVIGGKLTITNYCKQNDFDYPNPCNHRK